MNNTIISSIVTLIMSLMEKWKANFDQNQTTKNIFPLLLLLKKNPEPINSMLALGRRQAESDVIFSSVPVCFSAISMPLVWLVCFPQQGHGHVLPTRKTPTC